VTFLISSSDMSRSSKDIWLFGNFSTCYRRTYNGLCLRVIWLSYGLTVSVKWTSLVVSIIVRYNDRFLILFLTGS
jgi:hypothetical protein